MNVDVAIIGGGPAGCTLGNMLQKAGKSTCIIDIAQFPRTKICAGILSSKTITALKRIYTENVVNEVVTDKRNSVSIYYRQEHILSLDYTKNLYFIDRYWFDNYFIAYYVRNGGALFQQQAGYDINCLSSCIIMKDMSRINYRVLVGADGIYSKTRKLITENYEPNGYCAEVVVNSILPQFKEDMLHLYLGLVDKGFGWIIPQEKKTIIGLGGIANRKDEILSELHKLCTSIGVNIAEHKILCMHTAYGAYVKEPVRKNIILIGDAAGLGDPVTGEGIYHAILSAEYAFMDVMNYLGGGCTLSNFNKSIIELHNDIDKRKSYNKYVLSKHILNVILSNEAGIHAIQRLCADEYSSIEKYEYLRDLVINNKR